MNQASSQAAPGFAQGGAASGSVMHEVYITAFVIAIAIHAGTLYWVSHHRDETPAGFRLMAASGLIWGAAVFMSLLAGNSEQLHAALFTSAIVAKQLYWISATVFVFTLTDTVSLSQKQAVAAIGLIFFPFGVLVTTNPVHHLITTGEYIATTPFPHIEFVHGVGFIVITAIGYTAVIGAMVGLGWAYAGSSSVDRKVYALIAMSAVLVAAANLPFHFRVVPIDTTPLGTAAGLVLQATAIKRGGLLKRSPIALRTVVESIEEAVFMLNENGMVTAVNESGATLTGKRKQDIIGAHHTEVFPSSLSQCSGIQDRSEPFEEVISIPQAEIGQFAAEAASDSGLHLRVKTEPVERNIFSSGSGCTLVLQDVTDLIERQKTIEAQKEQLEVQNQQLDDFASKVSHDLRNPLGLAMGFAERAQKTGNDEDFEKLHENHKRMDEMIDEMLEITRTTGTLDSVEEFSLSETVTETWNYIDAPDASLNIDSDMTLTGDQVKLHSMFENLFKNAVQHSEQSVTISVGTLSNQDGFYVEDDGPGIPSCRRDKVFEEEFTTAEDGNGIGLKIVNQIASIHGWDINIADSSTGGARFEFVTAADTASKATTPALD